MIGMFRIASGIAQAYTKQARQNEPPQQQEEGAPLPRPILDRRGMSVRAIRDRNKHTGTFRERVAAANARYDQIRALQQAGVPRNQWPWLEPGECDSGPGRWVRSAGRGEPR